jgi:hypothetical protein
LLKTAAEILILGLMARARSLTALTTAVMLLRRQSSHACRAEPSASTSCGQL